MDWLPLLTCGDHFILRRSASEGACPWSRTFSPPARSLSTSCWKLEISVLVHCSCSVSLGDSGAVLDTSLSLVPSISLRPCRSVLALSSWMPVPCPAGPSDRSDFAACCSSSAGTLRSSARVHPPGFAESSSFRSLVARLGSPRESKRPLAL